MSMMVLKLYVLRCCWLNADSTSKNKLTRRELLEQLAEECSELTKAEELSENPTPTSRVEAEKNFTEEQLDIISVLYILTGSKMYEHIMYYPKYVRWAIRLGYQIPAECIINGNKCGG